MMILDEEGVPKILQKAVYMPLFREFYCEWFDGRKGFVCIELLSDRGYREWLHCLRKYNEYNYDCIIKDLEDYYLEYKQTL